jgi:hypothetical protein
MVPAGWLYRNRRDSGTSDVVIIGFSAFIKDQVAIIPGDDVSEAAFFELDKRPRLIFRVHEEFISSWLQKRQR